MPVTAAEICKRFDALKALRMPHEMHWRACFDFTFPLRGSGFQQNELDAQSAAALRAGLLDGTGTDAARILASAIMSGITPANSQWSEVEVEGADEQGKLFLSEASTKLWKLIHGSNFDAPAFECMIDLVCAGWFALFCDEDESDVFSFEAWPLSEVYATSTKKGGRVDTVYREYQLTAEQALATFDRPGDHLSDSISKLKPDEKITFLRAIYPRDDAPDNAMQARNLPIASCTVEKNSKQLVRESGYHEMPVGVPRWMMLPNSVYAIGPAFDALPDLRMLNHIKFNELASGDIAIGGMWKATDDGVVNPRTIKIGPRKVIVVGDIDNFQPLTTGSDFTVAFTMETRLQAAIRKIFMADQLQPQEGPQMTATEVHVRVALIRQLLGPTYGRLNSEYLQWLVERTFGIAYRAGRLGQAPDSLGGAPLHVKYTSPLALAQSLEEVSAMDRYETALLTTAGAGKPDVMDIYDWDEAERVRGQKLGVPARLIRPKDDVDAIRQARADAAQAQQTQEAVQGALEGAPPAQKLAGLVGTAKLSAVS